MRMITRLILNCNVVNKGNLEPGQTVGALPNYTGFRVSGNGRLSPIPHSTVEVIPGSHPTQALISPDGKLLFGVDLFAFPFPPPPGFPPFVPPFASALESFRIRSNGRLVQGTGTPQGSPIPPPFPPFMLGLQVHPTQPLLYVGFVVGNVMRTFRYDATGGLTFLNAAPISGLGICWIEVNKNVRLASDPAAVRGARPRAPERSCRALTRTELRSDSMHGRGGSLQSRSDMFFVGLERPARYFLPNITS